MHMLDFWSIFFVLCRHLLCYLQSFLSCPPSNFFFSEKILFLGGAGLLFNS